MKKILISILTILGIGFSFCSAETFITGDSYFWIFDNLFAFQSNSSSPISNNLSILNNFSFGFTGENYVIEKIYFSFNRFYVSSDSTLYVVLGSDSSDLFYSNVGILYKTDRDFNTFEFSFTNPPVFSSLSKIYWGIGTSDSNLSFSTNTVRADSLGCKCLNYCEVLNPVYDSSYYYPFGNSLLLLPIFTYNSRPTSNCISGLKFSKQASPKFKVNYGNTSYEYTLEDNLEIHLNSSVLKDGDNYSYNGSTGINLFYNGVSQRYNKSELYLFTPSWYSANIFNPICL